MVVRLLGRSARRLRSLGVSYDVLNELRRNNGAHMCSAVVASHDGEVGVVFVFVVVE